jgi:acyl-CoA synthetase (AMP-forming)/AMP-acid ligase II/pimeloyl-ACP methyl ester carboxylesterase
MYSIFSAACLKYPQLTAFILSNKQAISYQEADNIVNIWAKYLVALGITQGDSVAILTYNEDLHPFLHLAIDKINATTVPLDPEIPPAQLNADITKIDLKKILIDACLLNQFMIDPAIQNVLNTNGILPNNIDELLLVDLPEIIRDPAIANYIVGSSGVTQRKLIPILEAGLRYWAKIEKQLLKLKPEDKVLVRCSPGYDARLSEYVRSFAVGGTLVLMTRHDRRSLSVVLEYCQQETIACMIFIASQLNIPDLEQLIETLAAAGLKHLMVTGDACSSRLKKLCEKYNIILWNCYGPTEATFGSRIFPVNHIQIVDEKGEEIIPIGPVDGHEDEVKHHIINECLYIESPYLSTGYIGDPELTAKNFPHLMINGHLTRVFNTENRFSIIDNHLVFQGRINSNAHCKVSGVKVEAHAIQQCFEKYNSELGQEVLHAFVVVKTWLNKLKPFAYVCVLADFDKAHFMNFLKQWLRKEEMPIIIGLAEFPRLIPSEKIDSKALIARYDHPDEFFFNEGKKNKAKFSAGGTGIEVERLTVINEIVAKIAVEQLIIDDDKSLFLQIDELVLASNHLDQSLGNPTDKKTVLSWLHAAYNLFKQHKPLYFQSTIDYSSTHFSIEGLATLAQLLHYYGKALRYGSTALEERVKILETAVEVAQFLENQPEEDKHMFKGRLLTYNLAVMLCIRDQKDVEKALELAQRQLLSAHEKYEIFHIVQYNSYLASMLSEQNNLSQAYEHAEEALTVAKQFYYPHTLYFNASISMIDFCLKNNQKKRACELSYEILNLYQQNPQCGCKEHHIKKAEETLTAHDTFSHIWCNILGLSSIHANQEFMSLGGDSFMLQQLFTRIKKEIDSNYTYQLLVDIPELTFLHLANVIFTPPIVQSNRAVIQCLQKGDTSKPNYFFLPPITGASLSLIKFAREFHAHYGATVWALSDRSLFDAKYLPATLDDAIENYIAAIKSIQPTGPYYLLGFSFGGSLAYFVALRLHALGDKVKRLHIVDGFPPLLYQTLTASAHVQLLETLINFVIAILNNDYYSENLKKIRLVNYDKFTPEVQINKSLNGLISKVSNEPSKLMLALTHQHLLFMFKHKALIKLPIWVNFYLSTPDQVYLKIIDTIHKIVKQRANYQFYFWDNYFEEINLAGERSKVSHVDLIQVGRSTQNFWRKQARDPLFDLPLDYFGPTPFYLKKALTNGSCHYILCSLGIEEVNYYKSYACETHTLEALQLFPLYERIAQKYERQDRVFVRKFCLSFIIPIMQESACDSFLLEKKFRAHAYPLPKLFKHLNSLEPHFFINLDMYWCGSYFMGLCFACNGNEMQSLTKIFKQLNMNINSLSQPDKSFYSYSHLLFDYTNPSIFNGIEKVSEWLDEFIILLLPYIHLPDSSNDVLSAAQNLLMQ